MDPSKSSSPSQTQRLDPTAVRAGRGPHSERDGEGEGGEAPAEVGELV